MISFHDLFIAFSFPFSREFLSSKSVLVPENMFSSLEECFPFPPTPSEAFLFGGYTFLLRLCKTLHQQLAGSLFRGRVFFVFFASFWFP